VEFFAVLIVAISGITFCLGLYLVLPSVWVSLSIQSSWFDCDIIAGHTVDNDFHIFWKISCNFIPTFIVLLLVDQLFLWGMTAVHTHWP